MMIFKKRGWLIAIVVLITLGASCVVYAYRNRKSRAETLEWMRDFLPEHAGSFDIVGDLGTWRTSYTLKSEDCWVTITDLEERKNSANLHDYVDTYQFSLSDLDPTTIKAEFVTPGASSSEVALHADARDKRDMIHLYEDGKDYPRWGLSIIFLNKDDAERFAKALQRAVILCGGKASKF